MLSEHREGGFSPDVGVRKVLPENVIQRVTPHWPTEAAEWQRVRKVKGINCPRNTMYNSSTVGTELNGQDNATKLKGRRVGSR